MEDPGHHDSNRQRVGVLVDEAPLDFRVAFEVQEIDAFARGGCTEGPVHPLREQLLEAEGEGIGYQMELATWHQRIHLVDLLKEGVKWSRPFVFEYRECGQLFAVSVEIVAAEGLCVKHVESVV